MAYEMLPIQAQTWEEKYRFKAPGGLPRLTSDLTIEATWRRIAHALAAPEGNEARLWENKFYGALEGFQFLPAGRIIAGAGTGRDVTLFNCLGGDERFYSLERGLVSFHECSNGEVLSVWTKHGWKRATIRCFGKQNLNRITLMPAFASPNGWRTGKTKYARVVRATAEHRWFLVGKAESTSSLRTGDLVESCAPHNPNPSSAYYDGLCHGIIFGDGVYAGNPKKGNLGPGERERHHLHTIRLCGGKASLLQFFEQGTGRFTVSYPPSSQGAFSSKTGDPHLTYYRERDCKVLPHAADQPDYIAGFLEGLIVTDGCDIGRGRNIISTQNEAVADWVKAYAPLAGFIFVGSSSFDSEGYGNRKAPCQNLRLRRVENVKWRVVSIKPDAEENVYCASVEHEAAFTLEGGIYTGNCFVLGTVPDSMEGIFQRLKDGALTMQQGGGIGTDFSTLRPNGADVHGVAARASGPVSFMDCWDAMCKTIESAGVRRGAMMGTLRCDHPDIELFIDAKRDPLRLRNFNVSVLVTDAFMTAVKNDAPWDLIFNGVGFKQIRARALWDKIMRAAWETAEPGVIFIDRINETNNLAYCETISSTNPCAEQPLPPNGACLLGSINLAAFVRNPFEDGVYMAEHDIVNTVKLAVRMMDNVIDVSNYPLDAQRQEAQHKRRIGLGITGLADALAMCGLHYGTPEACNTAAVWMKTINSVAYETSLSLAAEKGKFPAFSEKMGNAYYPERRNGQALRNGTLTSIAPTGTISLLAGNISSGIEPMYDWEYERKVKQPDGSMKSVEVEDFAVRLYRQKFSGKPLPSQFWARAHDLSPRQHLNMQAALQRYVDSSISKTVNCPEDMSFADFEQLYLEAYDMGLKACAAFRPNAITGSILSTGGGGRSPEVHAAPFKEELIVGKDFMEGENQRARYRLAEGPMVELTTPGGRLTATGKKELIELVNKAAGSPFVITPREPVMKGRTHKIKWGAHAIYITINDREDGTPYEIFINSKHSEHYAWSVALTRMISAVWRLHPGDTGFIIEELKAIHDPRGGAWMGGRYIPSVQAAMGYVIDAHLNGKDNGFELHPEVPETDPSTLLNFPHWGSCPGCGSANVYFPKRGCLTCRDCGFSNCNE